MHSHILSSTSHSFLIYVGIGPCLDIHTVLQVLAETNAPMVTGRGGGANGGGHANGNGGMGAVNPNHHSNSAHTNAPPGWGPNRGGGALGGLQQSRSNSSTRRGRRK